VAVEFDPANLAQVLPPGGITFVQGCSGQSALLSNAVKRAGDALGAMTFISIFVPGLNRATWLANPACRARSFFMTPELNQARDAVEFLPLCYADILAHPQDTLIDAALLMVASPDANGLCSFGPVVDVLSELWPRIPNRLPISTRRCRVRTAIPAYRSRRSLPSSRRTCLCWGHRGLRSIRSRR